MTSEQSSAQRSVLLVVHTGREEATETARRVELPFSAVSATTSLTVPQVPQSGQRPTHLGITWLHSEQRYCERTFEATV